MGINMESESTTLYLRVLGYQEPDMSWVAHCLETDLVGYGPTFQAALDNLKELTEMQVSFAYYKNQPALLDRPAPSEIFEMYQLLLRENLHDFTLRDKIDRNRQITSIPWPHNLPDSGFAIAQM